jgi:phosphatidylethanolamine/phosphatidyl-N-methylethanolamine N-methyltransferase
MFTRSEQESNVRMITSMSTEGVANAYARLAPVYDFLFGPVFSRGRTEAVKVAGRIGGRILEVGVGTGLSLPKYTESNCITGVDISEPMLNVARKRVRKLGLANVISIEVGDAENLRFPSDSFDVVVAQYVVTACPNPEKALNEFARVVRPGGEIVITTRISADRGMRAAIEKVLMPVTTKLGWRTEFPFSRYTSWAADNATVKLVEHTPLPPLGHFSLIRFVKLGSAGANVSSLTGARDSGQPGVC